MKGAPAAVDARLRCIEILQETQADVDPVQLAVAVRQAQRLLKAEPCEAAILSHSQRLGMRAEDEVKGGKTLEEIVAPRRFRGLQEAFLNWFS